MSKKKQIPIPKRNLTTFKVGDEVRHLGIAHRTDDCHFEVTDPVNGITRSLMTGEDVTFEEGYFLTLSQVKKLPKTSDLNEAAKGDTFRNLLTGNEFQVISTEEHTVRLLDNSGQLSLHSRIGSSIFYKVNKDSGPPIDEDGQFLLFELE